MHEWLILLIPGGGDDHRWMCCIGAQLLVMSRMVWEALKLGSDARQGPLPRLLAGKCAGEWQALGATRRPCTACERGEGSVVNGGG